ncbi:MAG: LytTR family DNA-binding domain-containing protein [Bacteroidota bacterium]|nr:LytTR family DNA-binding domain-containing protein [Bacteroidota bacterium]
MKKLSVILIDDESSSRNALRQKLQTHCPDLEIVKECENGEEGILAIELEKPDIVFLDVEMPRMNGFVMLQRLLHRDFELIFTTAYEHYAVQAIRVSALDYLVKPIEIKSLVEAVDRARERRRGDVHNQRIENLLSNLVNEKDRNNRLAVASLEGLQFVLMDDIIYLEAESNYTSIYLQSDPRIIVSKVLKDFEELLPSNKFIRIHHSHIINLNHLRKYLKGEGGQVEMSNGKMLDISRRKKEEFIRAIGN